MACRCTSGRPTGWSCLVALLILAVHAPGAAGQEPVTLAGQVRDAITGRPVPNARISIAAAGEETLSGEDGRFTVRLPPGSHEVETTAEGYAPQRLAISIIAFGTARVDVMLQPEAVALPGIDVHTSPAARDPRLMGFWERRERGIGHFLTRDDIERGKSPRFIDVFRRVPGAKVERIDAIGGGHVITFGRRAVIGFGQRSSICPAVVYVDGAEYTLTERGLDDLRAEEIEAIEVYTGPARLPAQFNKTGSRTSRPGQVQADPQCGVIVVWTRL